MSSSKRQLQCLSNDYVLDGLDSDEEEEDRWFQSESSLSSSEDDAENIEGCCKVNTEREVWKHHPSGDEEGAQEYLWSEEDKSITSNLPAQDEDEVYNCLPTVESSSLINEDTCDGDSDLDTASPPVKRKCLTSDQVSRAMPQGLQEISKPQQSASDDRTWTDVTYDDSLAPSQFRFRPIREPGPQNFEHLQSSQTRALDIFKLFFSEELVGEMAAETNRSASVKDSSSSNDTSSRLQHWCKTTCNEMYLMLALLMNMGTIHAPSIGDYWTTKFHRELPIFRKVMTRNRFQLLFHTMLSCCYVDDGNRIRGDRIQPLVDKLNVSFQRYFQPYREVSADETMIGFKGRVAWKQYKPKKPNKWGLLVRTLADAKTGYLLNMKVYYGKTDGNQLPKGITKTENNVIELMKPYKNQGYHVFCDRLYSSLALGDYLALQKTHLTGTINGNRKAIPKSLPNEQGSGQRKAMRCGRVMVLSWCYKRPVYMISTFHRGDLTVQKCYSSRTLTVHKPLVIDSYNTYMGGMDLSGQYSQYYLMARKSTKWWKKILFWLLETSIMNGYILYKFSSPDPGKGITLLDYRDKLVHQLLVQYKNAIPRKRGRPGAHEKTFAMKSGFHAQRKVKGQRARECRHCSERTRGGKRKDTLYYCDTCIGKPGLHPGDCFTSYHSEISQLDNESEHSSGTTSQQI